MASPFHVGPEPNPLAPALMLAIAPAAIPAKESAAKFVGASPKKLKSVKAVVFSKAKSSTSVTLAGMEIAVSDAAFSNDLPLMLVTLDIADLNKPRYPFLLAQCLWQNHCN